MEEQTPLLERYPTLQYLLFMALGAFGVWVSMPLVYPPQSIVEWVDLVINLVIFVPCSLVAVGSGLLAGASAVFSIQPDEKGRFAKFAHAVLTAFGLRRLLQPDWGVLAPFGLLVSIFIDKDSEEAVPDQISESGDAPDRVQHDLERVHPETPRHHSMAELVEHDASEQCDKKQERERDVPAGLC